MIELEKIYFEHSESIFRFLFRMSGDSALSEEVTGKTFGEALANAAGYSGSFKIRSWLSYIAYNEYKKHLRRTRSEEKSNRELKPGEAIRKSILSLPEPYCRTLTLRLYAGLPFSEIAALEGLSQNSVKVIYCRAKRKLSEVM
ncbi:MAG: sigma-70 family RNA polymerase sigma factor [Clostridia bacterium]|nr:sigma-70 family RNA polymerase sigma factor [Clostridia bacterium]